MARVETDKCPTCKRLRGERHHATMKAPSIDTLSRQSDTGIVSATDGCRVEPDDYCPHGHASWMLRLGFI